MRIPSYLPIPSSLLWAMGMIAGFSSASATVTPNSLFTDHMVLQQGQPVPIWGTASPQEKISVQLGEGKEVQTTTGADGRWMVSLPPLTLSNKPSELVIRGDNEIRIQDVLVGEVWIGSGQSNMQLSVKETWDAKRVALAASAGTFGSIRLFRVNWTASDEPLSDTKSRWQTVSADTVASFSATLFYFGEALQQAMPGTPIGLIASSVGATNAHAWIPRAVLEKSPAAEPVRQWYRSQLDRLPNEDPIYDQKLLVYEDKVASYKRSGEPLPQDLQRPPEPPMGPRSKRRPASLYNGMIAPLFPYAFQGVVWYQGENNTSREWADSYADLMAGLIEGWRTEWAKAAGAEKRDFPFHIAQLPNFKTSNLWPLLREQQSLIPAKTKSASVAVLIDCGDAANIHPPNKTPAGQRLALLARAHTYGEKITADAPLLKTASFAHGEAILEFDQDHLQSRDGQALRHFEIAGRDRSYHPAEAEIKGRQIILRNADVSEPVAARYAWANNPENINFVNEAGLPASPFRTDDWPWTPPPAPTQP